MKKHPESLNLLNLETTTNPFSDQSRRRQNIDEYYDLDIKI